MDEFKLSMPVRFLPDKNSLDDIKKTLDTLDTVKIGDSSGDIKSMLNAYAAQTKTLDKLTAALNQYKAAANLGDEDDSVTSQLKEMIREVIGDNKSLQAKYGLDEQGTESFWQHGTEVFVGNMKTKIVDKLASIGQSILTGLKNIFTDAWAEMKSMMSAGLLTNAATRENVFGYGMSASESYGFEQAKSMLGISSEEDLWYMNEQQSQKFQEIMSRYAQKYEELSDRGFFDKLLDFQIESQEFQLDMKMEVIEFFMDNKDTIMRSFEIMMWGMETIVNLLDGIFGLLSPDDSTSDEARTANINSILREYTSNNQSSFVQNNNTTFNGATDSQVTSYVDTLNASMVETKKALEG